MIARTFGLSKQPIAGEIAGRAEDSAAVNRLNGLLGG